MLSRYAVRDSVTDVPDNHSERDCRGKRCGLNFASKVSK